MPQSKLQVHTPSHQGPLVQAALHLHDWTESAANYKMHNLGDRAMRKHLSVLTKLTIELYTSFTYLSKIKRKY